MTHDEWAQKYLIALFPERNRKAFADVWLTLTEECKASIRGGCAKSEDKMKLSHLEMLEKIGEREGVASLRCHEALECKRWIVFAGPHVSGVMSPVESDNEPEKAVEKAYNKLFPPIPKKVGAWQWNDGAEIWECMVGYVKADSPLEGGERTYRISCWNEKVAGSPWLRGSTYQDFLNLIAINPKLKPPTEE